MNEITKNDDSAMATAGEDTKLSGTTPEQYQDPCELLEIIFKDLDAIQIPEDDEIVNGEEVELNLTCSSWDDFDSAEPRLIDPTYNSKSAHLNPEFDGTFPKTMDANAWAPFTIDEELCATFGFDIEEEMTAIRRACTDASGAGRSRWGQLSEEDYKAIGQLLASPEVAQLWRDSVLGEPRA